MFKLICCIIKELQLIKLWKISFIQKLYMLLQKKKSCLRISYFDTAWKKCVRLRIFLSKICNSLKKKLHSYTLSLANFFVNLQFTKVLCTYLVVKRNAHFRSLPKITPSNFSSFSFVHLKYETSIKLAPNPFPPNGCFSKSRFAVADGLCLSFELMKFSVFDVLCNSFC